MWWLGAGATTIHTVTVTVSLDARRRTSLAKVGRKEHSQYLVEEHEDGSLTLIPAVTVSATELAALKDPEIRAAMDRARHPQRDKARSRGRFAHDT